MKVGDRVRGYKGIGTIIMIGYINSIGVEHDTWRGGHSCGSYGHFDVPRGSCWIYQKEDLFLVDKMTDVLAELNR